MSSFVVMPAAEVREPADILADERQHRNHPMRVGTRRVAVRYTPGALGAPPQTVEPRRCTMALGPIEVLVVNFPGNEFNGAIIPELERLVADDTISIVDGVLVRKDADGEVTFTEFEELGGNADAERLASVMDQLDSLISDEDIAELAAGLEPNSSEAILVFEHTWAKPLRDAIVDSGGVLADNFRVPGIDIGFL